MSDVELHRG